MPQTEDQFPPLFKEIRQGLEWIAKGLNRMEVEGLENLPPPGVGGLLCPSHENYSDPFYLGAAIPHRYLRFMGEPESLTMPLIGDLAKSMGVQGVQVSRGQSTDSGAVKSTLEVMKDRLQAGELCVVFPEGRIKHWIEGDHLHRFYTGAVRLAAKAGTPIYPAALYGTRWALPNLASLTPKGGKEIRIWAPINLPAKVLVAFGEGFEVDPRCDGNKEIAKTETARLRKKVADLRFSLKKRYPGVLG